MNRLYLGGLPEVVTSSYHKQEREDGVRETKGGKRDSLAKTGMAATAKGLGRGEGGGGVGQKWIQTAL